MNNIVQTKFYFFTTGSADGDASMQDKLGSKGANLSEMCKMSLSVPPGFVITTDVCKEYYKNGRQFPKGFEESLRTMVSKIEASTGKTFNSDNNPLLLSVRSGSAKSMPGMMDTILNVGIGSKSLRGVLKLYANNGRFVYDSYRRLIQMYSVVMLGLNDFDFEEILSGFKVMNGIKNDSDLNVEHLTSIVNSYKALVKQESGADFPDDPFAQLTGAIRAVFDSWTNSRAVKYRDMHKMNHNDGTAVTVQAMVFGNMNENSATGVIFSRNPSDGKNELFGEYLINAQGEDVVAGVRTPLPINDLTRADSLSQAMPSVYEELMKIAKQLEMHYSDMQDIEFTVENGKLWILQTRNGKRSVASSIKIAVDLCKEGLITKGQAITRVTPEELGCLFHPTIDHKKCGETVLTGLPASPGSASGLVVFDSVAAEKARINGMDVILFRTETSPEDIAGMDAARAIVTARGGMTSHAAVVARGMGKPCICGASELTINYKEQYADLRHMGKVHRINAKSVVTISGNTGEVFLGEVPLIRPTLTEDFYTLMKWCDEIRKIDIRANADTCNDYEVAMKFGAKGIGLCRTEHMFFEETRLGAMRRLIMSRDDKSREKAAEELLIIQSADFKDILRKAGEEPVTIRLLDPPLHEFVSDDPIVLQNISRAVKMTDEEALAVVESMREVNPMLGMRGVRLAVVSPIIYQTQIKAIFNAVSDLMNEGLKPHIEIMIPFVFCAKEMELLRKTTDYIAHDIVGPDYKYKLGSMIELPRAAVTADTIAVHVDFFSFGTNDLTQTTLGISRDDYNKFIDHYINQDIIKDDPFRTLDIEGVGELMKIAISKALSVNPKIKFGVCGEHGADPRNMRFFRDIGVHYVSCSPYSIAKARLAAAQIECN